jgi:hypothetical protein
VVPLSEEARQRFAGIVDQVDPSSTNPADDAALLRFVAWALVHEPGALQERFALESMMSERGWTDNRMRSVLTILHAAAPLVDAYERERDVSVAARPDSPRRAQPDQDG